MGPSTRVLEYSFGRRVLEYRFGTPVLRKNIKNRIFGFIKLKFILVYPLTTARVIRRVLTVLLTVSPRGGYL